MTDDVQRARTEAPPIGEAGTGPRARVGVVLAGGASRRMPGGKPMAVLAGRTLLARAVATVELAGLAPAVCAREGVELPATAARVWREPAGHGAAESPHPLRGVAWALRAANAPAVVLPVDLPLLPPSVLAGLAATPAPLAVLASAGRPAVLVVRAAPEHVAALEAAADAGAPALRTLVALGAELLDLAVLAPDAGEHALLNVNDAAALAEAEQLLSA